MAVIRSSVISVTKKEYDTSAAQQTADEAKQETIEINKTLTEVDKRVSEAHQKADKSLEKAQEGFDKGQSAIDDLANLKIGSNNLLPNSSFKYGFDNWEGAKTSPYFIRDAEADYPSAAILRILKNNDVSSAKSNMPIKIGLKKQYTISFDIRFIDGIPEQNKSIFIIRTFINATLPNSQANAKQQVTVLANKLGNDLTIGVWYRVSVPITSDSEFLRVVAHNSDVTSTVTTEHRRIQVEEGNIATDWTESSSDIDKAVLLVDNKTGVIAGRVTDAEGKITTLTATAEGLQTEVKSKADSSTVTQLADVVNTKVSNADFESNKTQTAELISASVKSKADSSTVTQLADVVNTKVSNADFESNKTQTAELINSTVEGLTIGESNYLYDSNFKSGAKDLMATSSAQARTFWRNSSTNGTIKSIVPMIENGFTAALKFKSAGTGQHMVAQDFIPCKKNQSVVLSGWFKAKAAGQGIQVQVGQGNAASDLDTYKGATFVASKADTWQKFEFVKVTDADTFTGVFLGGHNQIASEVWFANVKLEKGGKSTPWSESDFELASQSQITQLADNINLKVDTGDVINQINIDPKGIIISGKKISLDGDVSVLPGFKLKAETINGGTFNGNSFIKAIDIRTNDGNLPIEIKGKSSIDDAGIIIEQKTKDTTSGGIISDSRSILNNGLTVGTALDAANGDRRIDYTKDYSQVSSSGIVTPNIVRTSDRAVPYWNGTGSGDFSRTDVESLKANGISPASTGTHFYIGAKGEVRIVDEKGNSAAGITYKPLVASQLTAGNLSLNGANSFINKAGNSTWFVDGNGNRTDITCKTVSQSSLLSLKTDIKDVNPEDALADILATDVKQYRFIGEDTAETHTTFIIDDVNKTKKYNVPSQFLAEDKQGRDDGTVIGYLMLAMKAQNEQIKTLENEKNSLNERLSKIESLLNLD
ncbi:tail fiber domain-containing protein [Brochothrix thermosphacta]|uniref:tail fiber domain-containing protein n=1 Tax=Brochothrix thermosphacta TaxID=2756 RepID=UPI0039B1263E